MIKVTVRYFSDETLFESDETIGFYRWDTFKKHFERLIKWKVPFEVLSITGGEYQTGVRLKDTSIVVCAAGNCFEHDGNVIVIDRDLKPHQSEDQFIMYLNQVAKSRREDA